MNMLQFLLPNRKNQVEKTVGDEVTRERRVWQVVPRHDDVVLLFRYFRVDCT